MGVVSQEGEAGERRWLFVVVHRSFTVGDQKSGVGAGASGSIGAWGSGQTSLIRSGDAEE